MVKNILQFDEFNEDGKHAPSKGVIGVGVFKKINPPDFQLN